jgi:hypothetical protein
VLIFLEIWIVSACACWYYAEVELYLLFSSPP